MLKALLSIPLAFALAGPSPPPAAPTPEQPQWSDATPPQRFWRVGAFIVVLVPSANIPELCGSIGSPPPGSRIIACTRTIKVNGQDTVVVLMPHPCETAAFDSYAQILCHEHAHILGGWRHETP